MTHRLKNIFDPIQTSLGLLKRLVLIGIWFRGPIEVDVVIAEFKRRKAEVLYGHDVELIEGFTQSWLVRSRWEKKATASGCGGFLRMVVSLADQGLRADLFLRTDTLAFSVVVVLVLLNMFGENVYGVVFVLVLAVAFLVAMIRRDLEFYTSAAKRMSEPGPQE
jgi:hypothetical protein